MKTRCVLPALFIMLAIPVVASAAGETGTEGNLPEVDLDGFVSWTKNPSLEKEAGL